MLPDIRVASDKGVAACMDQVALADGAMPTSFIGTCCSMTWPEFVDSLTESMRCYKQCVAALDLACEFVTHWRHNECDILFLEMGTNRYTGLDFIEYELSIVKP
ncbi:hypothetical protein M0657_010066 [Pyricularia oryzae]|nr:hypothetical protein M0657_010066 [Pyricularia oryzae]KAI7913358.1 hypothetical protein M9X92_009502 [Pyricularia oryzae]